MLRSPRSVTEIKNVLFVERETVCQSKLYADDISLSSVFHDTNASEDYLNHDLEK